MRQAEQWKYPQKSCSKIRKGMKPIKKMENILENPARDRIVGKIRAKNMHI